MNSPAAELAQRLARDAETVCRHYLPNGRREGRYWLVGDVENTPGRSLFVRLTGPERGKGAAGKWTDAATAVDTAGYFNEVRALLSVGDLLWRVTMDNNGALVSCGWHVVVTKTATSVDVSDTAALATTNTD